MSLRVLRESTIQQRPAEDLPPIQNGRRYIPVDQVATKLEFPHTCSSDPDSGYEKAQRRVVDLFNRFATSGLLDCKTTRGPTRLQGGQSHCGNCQCAHWAITSNPRDDKMKRVLSCLENDQALTPNRERYLKNRMGIDTPEKENFLALETPQEKVEYVRKHITKEDLHSSFSGTPFIMQLGSTIEGPTEANRFDISIEKTFRPIVDALSDQVAEKEITYKTAMNKAYDALLQILQTATHNLTERENQVKKYHTLEEKIHLIEEKCTTDISDAEISDYIRSVKELIDLRKTLIIKLPYASRFNTLKFAEISHRKDFYWLKAFSATAEHLTEPSDLRIAFQSHLSRVSKDPFSNELPGLYNINIRLIESKAQLKGWEDVGLCNIQQLDKLLFGVMEDGKRRAPTEKELRIQLIDMTAKEKLPKKKKPLIGK